MRWTWLAICVLGAAPWMAQAEKPTSRPSDVSPPQRERSDRENFHRRLPHPLRPSWMQDLGQPTDEEWAQVTQFMKEHSPKRWAAMEQLLGEGKSGPKVRHWMYVRWKMLQTLRQESKDLYNQQIRTVKLEDDIFGLGREYRNSKDDSAKKAIQEAIRGKTVELLRAGIEERKLRIQQIESLLKQEKERLEKDGHNFDSLVNRRVEAELSSVQPLLPHHRPEPPPPSPEGPQ